MKGLKIIPKVQKLRLPRAGDGLRAVAQHAPQAGELAISWMEPARPTLLGIYRLRRRIATVAIAAATVLLFVHVVFGANGMVVYKQKKAEYQALQKSVQQLQLENERSIQQVQALKNNQSAIEKEAREQLGYARPGEYVYVPPTLPKPAPPSNHSARK